MDMYSVRGHVHGHGRAMCTRAPSLLECAARVATRVRVHELLIVYRGRACTYPILIAT